MNGLHRIGAIDRCRGVQDILIPRAAFEQVCAAEGREAGLIPLGACVHPFDDAGGKALGGRGVVGLAESQRARRVRSAAGDAMLGLHVCNSSRDNGVRGRLPEGA